MTKFESNPVPCEYYGYGKEKKPLFGAVYGDECEKLLATVTWELDFDCRTWGVKDWYVIVTGVYIFNVEYTERYDVLVTGIEVEIANEKAGEGLMVYDVELYDNARCVVNFGVNI